MKVFVACYLLVASVAQAGTNVPLQVPDPGTWDGNTCTGSNVNELVVTGFSADGNYLTVHTRGWVACGHSGRGSNLKYSRWCGTMTFDLAGNLVGTSIVSNNLYATFLKCPIADQSATYTNAGGYIGWTQEVVNNTYGTATYTPKLSAP